MMNSHDFPWHLLDTAALMQEPAPRDSVLYVLGFAYKPVSQSDALEAAADRNFIPIPKATNDDPQLLKQLRVECVTVDSIVVWFKRIAQADFTGEAGSRNLSDLNWLTPRVLAHEAVVAQLCEFFTFYPSRFGCLFSTIEKVSEFARAHATTLHEYFQHVVGRREWGIKFVADVDQATSCLTEQALAENSSSGSGSNYLKLKQLQRSMRPVAVEKLDRACEGAIAQLQDRFEVVLRPRAKSATPDRETLLANAAMLLTRHEAVDLNEWCEQWNTLQNVGMSVAARLSGPWPPYSFCPSLAELPAQRRAA